MRSLFWLLAVFAAAVAMVMLGRIDAGYALFVVPPYRIEASLLFFAVASLVAFIRDDHPGALLEILEQFATRGVNLTRIESRPTGRGLGKYCFAVDCEGHVADARVGEALMGLRRICADVRFLGSYPRADGVAPTLSYGTSNETFASAAGWLAGLRGEDS